MAQQEVHRPFVTDRVAVNDHGSTLYRFLIPISLDARRFPKARKSKKKI